MIIIICPCGKKVKTTYSRKDRKKYCSKKCFYIYRIRPRGLNYKIVKINKGWFKYKGGWIDSKGYKQTTRNSKNIRFHRLIMENKLGRKLKNNEVVHHINGNKLDNRIKNLRVMLKKKHDELHHKKLQ